MAEVATKKSINVVSSKKSEVCGVQSNNGLIDLDNITASNNQLISLCDTNNDDDDDLVLANNTRNELDTDDKSLQELIESELALRICSGNDDDDALAESEEPEEPEARAGEPETVRTIVLDRRRDHADVNAEFIAAESEHLSVIEEPFGYQNGRVSPETKVTEVVYDDEVKPEPIVDEEEEELFVEQREISGEVVVQKNTDEFDESRTESVDDEDSRPRVCEADFVQDVSLASFETASEPGALDEGQASGRRPENARLEPSDKYQMEQEDPLNVQGVQDAQDSPVIEKDDEQTPVDTWSEQEPSAEALQTGQFSDNFDEALCAPGEDVRTPNSDECVVRESVASRDLREAFEEKPMDGASEPTGFREEKELWERSEAGVETTEASCVQEPTRSCRPRSNEGLDDEAGTPSQSEGSTDAASTQEFIDTERRVLSEESIDPVLSVESNATNASLRDEQSGLRDEANLEEDKAPEVAYTDEINEPGSTRDRQTVVGEIQVHESSETSDLSNVTSTLVENTQVVVSETNVTIFSETKYVESTEVRETRDRIMAQETEQRGSFDSWMTVEEATQPVEDEDASGETEVETPQNGTTDRDASNDEIKADDRDSLEPSPSCANRAPLATPDDETSDISNVCDSETREETTTTTVVTSSTAKAGTKTKKKKIEGVAGNDASPNLTPRTKKTKKSKKSDLEKENISVNCNLQDPSMRSDARQTRPDSIDLSDEDDLANVNVKSLTQNYVSEATRSEHERSSKERIATGVSIKQLCRSFGDISNMNEVDQATIFGRPNHAARNDEKARSMGDLSVCERGYSRFTEDAPVFAGVSVKALRASYCSLASLTSEGGKDKERAFGRSRHEKSSFNKFDALSKKSVLHVRSVDAGKVQQQLNAVGQNGDTNPNCRSCGKVVFQMEQTKAEGLVWHKNCFRCVQCSKQLNVDNYESHESTLYCKPHFKELFQPKPVEESDQPVRPRKPELIIRENEPKELPPDVVRASDKPDLGLEELSSLNVKSRFQVFEKAGTESGANEIERSPSQIAVKRSPSILSKLAKFQAKGMDIGVADESLNGIPYEESSESEEEEDTEETEEVDTEIVKAKRATRERPISFSKMDDIKSRWETTSQQGRREVQREARKEEIAGIRSRLFMGKQGKMKEMYQQAVAGSERVTKINAAEEIQHSTHARSIKERFERGEPIASTDDETDGKPKPEKADEEVIAAGIGRKSRSLFLELDASAAKTGRPVTPVNPKTPADTPRRARDAFMARQVSDDVVRSTDTAEEVQVETSDISNKFKFFESYKEPEKQRRQFRITPPRDGQVKMDSPEREIYRDPDVVRADDRVDEVVHTDTARKMLSIFRQMEENATKEELPDGPKPLKRFTPPPEDKFAKPTASDSEEDEDEEAEESEADESAEERDPNYVRASDKVEDEFLKQAQNAARAKTLRAKFEHWEETDGKVSNHHVAEMEMAQGTGEQSSIESASSLRARFESLGSQTSDSPRTQKVKVHRFVEIQTSCVDVCLSCEKKVYPLEKVETDNRIFHKHCFRCLHCNCVLRMDTFTLNNGKLYCIPHFKQLFIARGNYDEGFGVDPHKNKWATSNAGNSTTTTTATSAPIAVSNGDL